MAILLDKYKLIRIDERVYYIDHMPVHTQPLDLVLTLVASLGVAALATLYPSRQAAKLSPIEAIHHE
jgi:lipoprotein-releasing system permease protein